MRKPSKYFSLSVCATCWCWLVFAPLVWGAVAENPVRGEPFDNFKARLGIQMWSLRAPAKNNPFAAMDLARDYGMVEVETAGTGGLSGVAYAQALHERGMRAVSAHVPYSRLEKDLSGVISEAKALGVQYVICPTLSHQVGIFDALGIAREFEEWGSAMRSAGLRFGYHPHGFEFRPTESGATAFDILMANTTTENVCYEMDVFWVVHAGVDPISLLKKYPDRWRLMHLKDMRKGVLTGSHTGDAPATDNTPLGQGQIDWRSVLRTAHEVGIQYYFIEDETAAPLDSIPVSLAYLNSLQL